MLVQQNIMNYINKYTVKRIRKMEQIISKLVEKRNVRRIIDKFSLFSKGRVKYRGKTERPKFSTVSEIISNHFGFFTDEDHPNKETMTLALELLNSKKAVILETGSSAWGTNSTLLFDSYVNSFGGSFDSVDIRLQPAISLRAKCSNHTTLHCDDSVSFLKKYSNHNKKVDLVYLDSWDVKWSDPLPSAMHGLNELLAIFPRLEKGSIILVDDTPLDQEVMKKVQPNHIESFIKFKKKYGFPPGKGSLIKFFLEHQRIGKKIAHSYQLLWQL